MQLGYAVPQYPFSVGRGVESLTFETVVEHARAAVDSGFSSLWVSDHLAWDVGKYGGPAHQEPGLEPIVLLGALAQCFSQVRLGTLVLCEALRPPAVLAKAVATLDRVSSGRVDVGLGAGWYEPDYEAIGMKMPSPGERLGRLAETLQIVGGMLAGDDVTYDGRFHSARGARTRPDPVQRPRPQVFVGGKGDRLLRVIAEHADGWNTCWAWTTAEYRERLDVLERACAAVDRDPSTVRRSLGLYALCGEDEADLARRFDRLREQSPAGVLDGVTLDEWRVGRLVGTVEQVRGQVAQWEALGVETLILSVGCVPFHTGALDDVALLGRALNG